MVRAESRAQLTLRWRDGTLTTIALPLPRSNPRGIRTDEETIALLPRLAAHYSDEVIAGILNKQGRKTATGERFTANQVGACAAIGIFPASNHPPTRRLAMS